MRLRRFKARFQASDWGLAIYLGRRDMGRSWQAVGRAKCGQVYVGPEEGYVQEMGAGLTFGSRFLSSSHA